MTRIGNRREFARGLMRARRVAAHTQGEAAASIGVSLNSVHRWEAGTRFPGPLHYAAALRYFARADRAFHKAREGR